ncbi:MAG: DM13 domain-containing protein [Actinomycetota bacterium]|nr:DM13 domain-containing protein [Actinomycetota bacterium]
MDARRPNPVIVVGSMLVLIAAGSLLLQRELAETMTAALVLSIAWAGVVGIGFLAYARPRSLLRPVIGGLAIGAVVAGASYYWFSLRDERVDEEVVSATPVGETAAAQPPGPVNVAEASGSFSGEDGHDGSGTATVIREASGERKLTFTDFDVDPGAAVVVWLTAGPNETEDRIELGDLKGNVGDQQYEVPADADLDRYGTVMLYCTPFTVRIAVADLAAV